MQSLYDFLYNMVMQRVVIARKFKHSAGFFSLSYSSFSGIHIYTLALVSDLAGLDSLSLCNLETYIAEAKPRCHSVMHVTYRI